MQKVLGFQVFHAFRRLEPQPNKLSNIETLWKNHSSVSSDLSHKSHNTPVLYPTLRQFVTEMYPRELTRRPGTRKWDLRLHGLYMSCSNLMKLLSRSLMFPGITARVTSSLVPLITFRISPWLFQPSLLFVRFTSFVNVSDCLMTGSQRRLPTITQNKELVIHVSTLIHAF